MGILEMVADRLRPADFLAEAAFPGRKYPVIGEPVAAVHLHKADRVRGTVTVEVSILCPESYGGVFCEEEALRAVEVLHRAGAVCTQEGCRYNGLARIYSVSILAELPWADEGAAGDRLQFKTFIWPQQPEEYREEFLREPVYVKNGAGDSVFSGMGPMKRVILGSGAFRGADAYTNFGSLAALFAENGTGTLIHPTFGSRTVYFTGLQLHQSPRRDYVAYSFEFTEADADGAIPK